MELIRMYFGEQEGNYEVQYREKEWNVELGGMNTVENESSELRCLGRARLRGRTPATSGCQVLLMLSQLYGQ